VGLNWYLNRFIGIRTNIVREVQEQDGPFPMLDRVWSRTLRVQFQF